MILVTTSKIECKTITKSIGLVRGNTIRAKWFGRDIAAGLKQIVGGELKGYTEMLTEAREEALKRMIVEAENKGANAIIGVRFTTSQVMPNAAEILVYGTAVNIE
jgi:uncharacterized protein YbjQ (UPF0145 family)|tara:strand:- start:492 stop:806 length:315 start_codon:yes stop_codon:yes gene_type:complete